MSGLKLFGLIGETLKHSFSERYFEEKFTKLGLKDYDYRNFEISSIEEFTKLLEFFPELRGVNVTFPYKQQIMEYLDFIDPEAELVGAVNVVLIQHFENKNVLRGYNTDIYGFEVSLLNFVRASNVKALVLGTGGASKAVTFVLKKFNIEYDLVSRTLQNGTKYLYQDLSKKIISEHNLIINTTPVGQFPNVDIYPAIPYEYLTKEHYLIDLIYNPQITKFLQFGKEKGAMILNGIEMLILQAEKSWDLFKN